jgi:hypothetical protein
MNPSKKIAILLFGISKQEKYNHRDNYTTSINYERSYENYKKMIFKFFQNKGYDIDIYFTTNIIDDTDKQKICELYNPRQCNFIENESNFYISRNMKINNVVDLCLQSGITYDLVLITRFDLNFNIDFNKSNINLNKFNLVSILESPHLICDNFYLFPYKSLNAFSNICKKNMNKSFHLIKKDIDSIKGPLYVNYILNEYTYIANLTFYTIIREKLIVGISNTGEHSPSAPTALTPRVVFSPHREIFSFFPSAPTSLDLNRRS